MISAYSTTFRPDFGELFRRTAAIAFGILSLVTLFCGVVLSQTPRVSETSDDQTLIIEGNQNTPIFAFGKNVIVARGAKEVLVFGGNVTIEGRVEGDVGTIGGNVIQAENSFIGGDVIVLGGSYQPARENAQRVEGRETVIIGVFEEELRDFAKNPSSIFSPALSWSFFGQRLLSVLFWFLISFVATTISPGAISRSVARFHLSTLKIVAIGISGFLATTLGIVLSVSFLPGYMSGVIGLMMLFLLMFAYVFGRVTLQVSVGKLLQKHLIPESMHSETFAILLGVAAWTLILSVPYIWTAALLLLFSVSIGLVFTARAKNGWRSA